MAITKDEVRYVAKLARLKLADEEVEYFTGQLGRILDYIDQLKRVDTSSAGPTSHVLTIKNIFHKDIVRPSLTAEAVLKNAPSTEGTLFKVPRIIEES